MLDKISIGIRTFLRDEHLFHAIQGIQENLPEVQMVIADCGEMSDEKDGVYMDLERAGHKVFILPFDAGFGAMSNKIAQNFDREYLLIGSDDFDFEPTEVRCGIWKLQEILDLAEDVDIASGRVNNNPYEFYLTTVGEGQLKEENIHYNDHTILPMKYWYARCDLTVNYSLIRRRVFETVKWDEPTPKIGGSEHSAFFIDCMRAGFKTVYVPDVNINELKIRNSSRYNQYRRRANDPARPCLDRRGITKYILGNGQIDYEKGK